MARMIYTTKNIAYGHYGMAAYRIEIDNTLPVAPLQRHIWTRDDGTEMTEEWIRSIRQSPERLLASGYTAIIVDN